MTFKEFNQKTFKNDKEIVWFDKVGVIKLDDNRRAEIELSTAGISEHYEKYQVTITHKQNGKITTKSFKFEDYLQEKDRVDNRPDYRSENGFHVWTNNKSSDWYIAVPSEKNIKNLTTAVKEFIELYR